MTPVEALCFDLNSALQDGSVIREAIRRTCAEAAAPQPCAALRDAGGQADLVPLLGRYHSSSRSA